MGSGTLLRDWGVASHSRDGITVSGDRHVVANFARGALVAVIDGLGHGVPAAEVAEEAAAVLTANPDDDPIVLMQACHSRLRASRGAVMSLASLGEDRMRWLGVGNVEGMLVRPGDRRERRSLLVRGGVVGYRLPRLLESEHDLRPGDTLIMATDGVSPEALREVPLGPTSEATAKAILEAGSAGNDDALVLAATYSGNGR